MSDENNKGIAQTPSWALITEPKVLAEHILNDKKFTGTLTLPANTKVDTDIPTTMTIPFHIDGDFGFSLGNEWGTLVPEGVGDFLNTIYNLYSMSGLPGADDSAQFKFVSRAMQALTWKGSQNPEFQVNAVFVCTRRSYNPTKIIQILTSTCLPLRQDEVVNDAAIKYARGMAETMIDTGVNLAGKAADVVNKPEAKNQLNEGGRKAKEALKNMGLFAPLEYNVKFNWEKDSADALGGVMSLQIGNWFKADNLVMKGLSNIQFSKEIIAPESRQRRRHNLYSFNDTESDYDATGTPLWVKCTLNLVPIQPITYSEFKNYFIFRSTNALDAELSLDEMNSPIAQSIRSGMDESMLNQQGIYGSVLDQQGIMGGNP